MHICFHDNSLSVRGTTVAVFDYAFYCQKFFGLTSSILYCENHIANDKSVIKKFKQEFNVVRSYKTLHELNVLLEDISPDAFFMEKAGPYDGVISSVCKNWIHAISICQPNQIYGDKFCMGSKWLSYIVSYKIPYVPYMINLPDIHYDNFRQELNIPQDSIVFGRNGGHNTFDLDFVKEAIKDTLKTRNDIFFLFQGTDKFYEHDNIIYLPKSPDIYTKIKLINTTDALLHARYIGESFGATCAEFSYLNKPVITWYGSRERNHIDILGDIGIYYNNYSDIFKILNNFKVDQNKDYNAYKDYSPEKVMKIFEEQYLI